MLKLPSDYQIHWLCQISAYWWLSFTGEGLLSVHVKVTPPIYNLLFYVLFSLLSSCFLFSFFSWLDTYVSLCYAKAKILDVLIFLRYCHRIPNSAGDFFFFYLSCLILLLYDIIFQITFQDILDHCMGHLLLEVLCFLGIKC